MCLFFLQERVGNFLADFYSVNGLVLESRKRREHLSEEDILRNKAIMESLSKGGNLIEQNFEVSQGLNRADGHSNILVGLSRERAAPPESHHHPKSQYRTHRITSIKNKRRCRIFMNILHLALI